MGPEKLPRAEEYRTLAMECEERSKRVQDPQAKQAYLELARGWQALADHSKKSRR
jgi:hypothetical protein